MLSQFCIRRPIFATVLSLIIILAGLVALRVLPLSQYPNITPPTVRISATYDGADSETISRTVAAPIEDQLSGIEGLLYYTTSIRSNGDMSIACVFDVGVNANDAMLEINNRVRTAERRLPDTVREQGVSVRKRTDEDLLMLALWSPDGSMSATEMADYANLNIVDELKRLPGIGDVNVVTDFDMAHALRQDVSGFDSLHHKGVHIYYRGHPFLRPEILSQNISIGTGEFYSEAALQNTQSALGRLHIIKYSDIRFQENAQDSTMLDCYILLSRNKPNSFSAELEGTNSAGDLGAAASLSYQNRNLFNGSELFTFKVRGAYEAVTGLQGYNNENYVEYGVEASINFPRFLFPFISADVRRRTQATSEIGLQYNSQDRPEFGRRVASVTWGYQWSYKQKWRHRVDVLDLNYVYMPWISSTFRKEYLDNVENQNSILKYNYENLLIMKMGYGFTYRSDGNHSRTALGNSYSVRFNVESSGNLLYGFSHLLNAKRNEDHQYTVMNIAYAQYLKTDIDFTKSFMIDHRNDIVFHVGLGIAFPYGNSRILPFEKRYFAGGANSVRGWSVRRLGPGKFAGSDRNIDFINQSGDIKLDINLEYRTKLFWKLNGAFFIDAGNIWTIREYEEQPGGAFKFDSFYKEIAVAYGLGLRFDFDYFILRFDGGMKAINPAFESGKERYSIIHPDFGRDFAFHFAVGYPF